MIKLTIVEDDEDDLDFLTEGLLSVKEVKISNLRDGIELLNRLNEKSVSDRPDAIIMDLIMPLKDGYETLLELKCSDRYRNIPVFILTSSSLQEQNCLDAGCALFFLKPSSIKEYKSLAERIFQYLDTEITDQ